MTALEILTILQKDIHTAVFATADEPGLPQTRLRATPHSRFTF